MSSAQMVSRETQSVPRQPLPSIGRSGAEPLTAYAAVPAWMALMGLVTWAAYEATYGAYYTPRSNFGFYLGVVGTLMMLALLAYPLRKRVRWMQRWGALKYWFRVHMWLGILGPTLVLFHSTFHIRSTNAAVALFSMLFVVASGVIGRFVYTHIHYGLYGRRATLEKLREEWRSHADETKARMHIAPQVERWVRSFEEEALEQERAFLVALYRFLWLGFRRRWVALRCGRQLRRIAHSEQSLPARRSAAAALELVSGYLEEVQRVAQFSAYERLFSLWHVLHIPLIYILAASTVFHVVAVYMY